MKEVNFKDEKLVQDYLDQDRWSGIKRNYTSKDVSSLRSPFKVSNTISEKGSLSLWELLNRESAWVSGLGAATIQQGVQMLKAGLEIIYVSGWQIASESNIGDNTYPDLSLYPSNSGPNFIKKMNNTLLRVISEKEMDSLPPIVADAESGFGGIYSVFNLTAQFINSGISGLHFEDQLASEKKCGHMGGKVVIPTREFINKLNASRLASDVLETPIILIARTDALNAKLITSDFDDVDKPYLTGKRTQDGYFELKNNKKAEFYKEDIKAEISWINLEYKKCVMVPSYMGQNFLGVIALFFNNDESPELNSDLINILHTSMKIIWHHSNYSTDDLMESILIESGRTLKKNENVFEVGTLKFDKNKSEVSIDGNYIDLTKQEFNILELLAINNGEFVTPEEFIEKSWGENNVSTAACLLYTSDAADE